MHSDLVGSVPDKSQTNKSGSDKRELHTTAGSGKRHIGGVLGKSKNVRSH